MNTKGFVQQGQGSAVLQHTALGLPAEQGV